MAPKSRFKSTSRPAPDIKVVASRHGVTQQTVSKWSARFVNHQLNRLLDAPRPGAPRTIDDARIDAMIAKTLENTPDAATHWSTRTMACEIGLAQRRCLASGAHRTSASSPRDLQALRRSATPSRCLFPARSHFNDGPPSPDP
jgi:hypothetical protein